MTEIRLNKERKVEPRERIINMALTETTSSNISDKNISPDFLRLAYSILFSEHDNKTIYTKEQLSRFENSMILIEKRLNELNQSL